MRAKASRPRSTRVELRGLATLPAFQAPVISTAFKYLRVGAAVWSVPGWFLLFDAEPSVMLFEMGHGHGPDRYDHNRRCFARVQREGRPLLAEHAGFEDFFVPVINEHGVQAILVVGPIATRRPTSGDLLRRWLWLTGRNGHPSDPEFVHYLSLTLETLTLEGQQLRRLERLLLCLAQLLAGVGDARALARRAAALTGKLEEARFVDRIWDAARSMIDQRTAATWLAPHTRQDLAKLGKRRLPEHVLVGLMAGGPEASQSVDAMLRRDAYQRACVEAAQAFDGVLCGKVSDHGVTFLTSFSRGARARDEQRRLAEHMAGIARRRFGLEVHFGASAAGVPGVSASLRERYEQALAASERALVQKLPFIQAEANSSVGSTSIRTLRQQLGTISTEQVKTLGPTFERFIEAVAAHSRYRVEVARAHLEAGFDQAALALTRAGTLLEKSYVEMSEALERAARDAVTLSDLFAAYRSAVAELADLAERPSIAARDRSLRRSIDFIHHHFSDSIDLAQVARVAGFSPNYFGQLFKQREQMTFEHYVRQLRIERAKQLLGVTDLSAEKVGQLSGFPVRPYFYRAFKEIVGVTPAAYRRSR